MNFEKYDVIVLGAGIAGCCAARLLAEKGKKVLVLEKERELGGAAADDYRADRKEVVQKYGIHILYTNHDDVIKFVSKFSGLLPVSMTASTYIDGRYISLPVNFYTFDDFFDSNTSKEIKEFLLGHFGYGERVKYSELKALFEASSFKHSKSVLYLLDRLYGDYSKKQWGENKENNAVLDRVLFIIGYTKNYYPCKYYFVPELGFSSLFHKMIKHENITVLLNENAFKNLEEIKNSGKKIINTCRIDLFYNKIFGELLFKSLDFKYERERERLPTNAVHFPDTYDFIRVSDMGKLYNVSEGELATRVFEIPKTIEESKDMKPFYTIMTPAMEELKNKYLAIDDGVIHIGRAAEYNYYTMDALIKKVLDLFGGEE